MSEAVAVPETITVEAMRAEACVVRGRRVEVEIAPISDATYAVRVMDRNAARWRACGPDRVHPVVLELAEELRVAAQPGAAQFAKDGLSSDYWWKDYTLEQADAARRWARLVLLAMPHQSGHDTDRFIASLDPPKVEELIRRAVNGRDAAGF